MNPKTITLTHANLGEKIEVAVTLMAAWYNSPGAKCTFVLASGGALLPVSESVADITRLYNSATTGQQLAMMPAAKTAETSKE